MVWQFQSRLVRIGWKRFLLIWWENSFLSFKLITTDPQEKSCLPNWFTMFHMVIEEILLPTVFVRQWTSIDYCKTSDLFFWFIFLVSSPLSLITMRFSHSSSMKTRIGKSSKFPMSSTSMQSCFSTKFSETLYLLQWNRDFSGNKTSKVKQVSANAVSLILFYSIHIFNMQPSCYGSNVKNGLKVN